MTGKYITLLLEVVSDENQPAETRAVCVIASMSSSLLRSAQEPFNWFEAM